MKFKDDRPLATPEVAERKLLEQANATESETVVKSYQLESGCSISRSGLDWDYCLSRFRPYLIEMGIAIVLHPALLTTFRVRAHMKKAPD